MLERNEDKILKTQYVVEGFDIKDSLSLEEWEETAPTSKETLIDAKKVDENGKPLTYQRDKIIQGDGIHTLDQIIGSDEVTCKFVIVKMKIKNLSDTQDTVCINPGFMLLDNTGKVIIDELPSGIGAFGEGAPDMVSLHGQGEKDYFMHMFAPGEEKECVLGYYIEEDKIPNIVLNFNQGAPVDDPSATNYWFKLKY